MCKATGRYLYRLGGRAASMTIAAKPTALRPGLQCAAVPLSPDLPRCRCMSVCPPAPRRMQRVWRLAGLLLLCLLVAAGCAVRGRSAAAPTVTPTATPAPVRFLAVPTFTPTAPAPAPTFTPPSTALPTFNTLAAPDQAVAAEPGGGVVHRRGAPPLPIQGRCHAAVLPHEHHARALVGLRTNDDGRVTALNLRL